MDNDSPVLWIRLDPEMTILRSCIIEQPEYQWNYQLRHEKDVTAQMEAVVALDKFPTIATRNALCDIIENEQVYIHIRCKAAHCLTKIANAMVTNWTGPPAMLATFKKMFGSFSCPHIIKQNNFSNLQHYYIQKTIPVAMAGLRNSHGICPPEILKFILDLFKYNDNSKNRYSDNYYRAALIDALGATVTPVISLMQKACDITADSLSGDSKLILEEITQHLNIEKRLQTYKYPITIACLKAIRKLQKFGHLPNNPNIFRSYASYGNFIDVRLCALEALVDFTCLDGRWEDLKYLIDIADSDPDPKVRNELVRMLCKNPPFTPKKPNNRLNNEYLVHHLWKLINSLLSYDTTLRCNFIDLYHTLYGKQKVLRSEIAALYKPIKVEVEAKSCTLPSIIVEPDTNLNEERGIKRSSNYDDPLMIPQVTDDIVKIEDNLAQNAFDDPLFKKKIKTEVKEELQEILNTNKCVTLISSVQSSIEVTEQKTKTGYFSENSASLPGIMVSNTSGPVGFEPGMFKAKSDDILMKQVTQSETSKHHHHHHHHHHSKVDGSSTSSKKKKKEKKKHKHKHKHKHEHKHKQDKAKEKKDESSIIKVKEETLTSGGSSSSDDTSRDLGVFI